MMMNKPTYEELEQRVLELEQAESKNKQLEIALRKIKTRYKIVFDSSPAVLYQFEMSPNGTLSFSYVSNAVMSIFGISPEAVINDSSELFDMVHPEDQKMLQEGIMKSAETLESFPMTFRYRKDGELGWIEARGVPTLLKDDGTKIWAGFLLDITDRKLVEEQRDKIIVDLEKALAEVKTLQEIIPICCSCKNVKNSTGYWQQVEQYISDHSEAKFTHGFCPDCYKEEMAKIESWGKNKSSEKPLC